MLFIYFTGGNIIGKAEVDEDLKSNSSLQTCSKFEGANNLFIFPNEVSNVDSLSVSYYGTDKTNETNLTEVHRLAAFFIIFEKNGLEEYELCNLRRLIQLPDQNRIRKVDISEAGSCSSCNAKFLFGIYIANDCSLNNNGSLICPLKLNFFSNSSTLLHTTVTLNMNPSANNLRNRIQSININDLEPMFVALNVKIEYQEKEGKMSFVLATEPMYIK